MGEGSAVGNPSLTSELLLLAKSFTSSVLIVLLLACLWEGQKQVTSTFALQVPTEHASSWPDLHLAGVSEEPLVLDYGH